MDFLQALNNSRYNDFKLLYFNGLSLGSVTSFKNIGDIYIKSIQRLELSKKSKGGRAIFIIISTPQFPNKRKT